MDKKRKAEKRIAHIDFETRGTIDLTKVGTVRYATHPETLVLCMAMHWRGDDYFFNPASNRKEIKKVIEALHDSGDTVMAYNWQFEYYILRYVCTRLYGWPEFTIDRFQCAMAQSLRYCLPGNLAADTDFMQVTPKDAEGHRVMMRLTKPFTPGTKQKNDNPERRLWYDNDPGKHQANQAYCAQDVIAETELANAVPELSKKEMKIFRIDQRMNTYGVAVDVPLCQGALKVFEQYKVDLLKQIPAKAWKHFDAITQREKVKDYLNKIDKDLHLPNMQADTLNAMMRTCTNKTAQRVMNAYIETGGQAINKYRAVLQYEHDGRLYGSLQYCGAAGTGRWSGRGIQPQNMNRPTVAHNDNAIELITAGDYNGLLKLADTLTNYDKSQTKVADLLKSHMRGVIIPTPGTLLAVNDYKAIEARLVFWCAGCKSGLELFTSGGDPYVDQAATTFDLKRKKVTDQQRFLGKQTILGAGYGMGVTRFVDQLADMGHIVSVGLASKSINAYRKTFHEVKDYWRTIDNTLLFMLENNIKQKWLNCGKVDFGWFGDAVVMRLPSGTLLHYHKMHARDGDLYYYTTPTSGPRKMAIRKVWGGTILQNMCEAIARELMAEAMIRLDALDYLNLLCIHDELINQIAHKDCMPEVQACITTKSKWCKTIPIDIEGAVLNRYQKI